jgi:hypothetical protein
MSPRQSELLRLVNEKLKQAFWGYPKHDRLLSYKEILEKPEEPSQYFFQSIEDLLDQCRF